MISNYENGRYQDKGLNNLNNMGNMNVEHIKRVNVSVPEINTYLRWLRNEISNQSKDNNIIIVNNVLASSCEVYCVLSDSGGDFCGDVLMKASERRDKRYEKEKEREHRKKMEEMKQNKK